MGQHVIVPTDNRRLSFRKGDFTLEFDTTVYLTPMQTVGQWAFQFTHDERFICENMRLIDALEAAEVHARARGYIFMRVMIFTKEPING